MIVDCVYKNVVDTYSCFKSNYCNDEQSVNSWQLVVILVHLYRVSVDSDGPLEQCIMTENLMQDKISGVIFGNCKCIKKNFSISFNNSSLVIKMMLCVNTTEMVDYFVNN